VVVGLEVGPEVVGLKLGAEVGAEVVGAAVTPQHVIGQFVSISALVAGLVHQPRFRKSVHDGVLILSVPAQDGTAVGKEVGDDGSEVVGTGMVGDEVGVGVGSELEGDGDGTKVGSELVGGELVIGVVGDDVGHSFEAKQLPNAQVTGQLAVTNATTTLSLLPRVAIESTKRRAVGVRSPPSSHTDVSVLQVISIVPSSPRAIEARAVIKASLSQLAQGQRPRPASPAVVRPPGTHRASPLLHPQGPVHSSEQIIRSQ
jgi:hypothetical protein